MSAFSSGGGGGAFSSSSAPPLSHRSRSTKKKGGRGPLGFVGNLLGDLKDAAVGLPTGAVMLVKDPIKGVKAIGNETWKTWSPLFHLDVDEFAANLYAHPLAPLLDVATVFTLGAGSVGKGAKALSTAGMAKEGGKVARLAEYSKGGKITFEHSKGGPALDKFTSKNPGTRWRQEKTHKALNALSPHLPDWFGRGFTSKDARYERLLTRKTSARKAAMMTQIAAFVKAGKDLSGPNRDKVHRGLLEHSYGEFRQFAFKHDPSEAIPEGWLVVEDAPSPRSPVVKAMERKLKNEQKRLSGLARTLDRDYGIRIGDAKGAKGWEKRLNQKLKKLDPLSQRASHNVVNRRLEMVRKYRIQAKTVHELERAYTSKSNRLAKDVDKFFKPHDNFEADMEGFAQRYTLRRENGELDLTKAARSEDGKSILIVPKHTSEKLGKDFLESHRTLKLLYQEPTLIWKTLMLGYRPAFLVNNVVGNYFMYAMAHGGAGAVRGYVDALRQVHGERTVQRSLSGVEKAMRKGTGQKVNGKHGDFQLRHFKDQLTNTFHSSALDTLGKRSSKVAQRYSLFGATHALADRFLRRATINAVLRQSDDVKALMRKHGWSFDHAADIALRNKPELRDFVSQKVMDTMGDYHSLNTLERGVREFIPFYTWDRHIARYVKMLANEKPGRTAATARVGQMGAEETERLLGEIPQFLKGAIPLSLLGLKTDHPSRIAVLQTHGLNPLATVPELAESVGSVVGVGERRPGETLGSQLNPFVASAVEYLSGHDLLSDAPVKQGLGGIPRAAANVFTDLPQWQLLKHAADHGMGAPLPKPNERTGHRTPFLFEKSFMEKFGAYSGVPYKNVSQKRARELAKRQKQQRSVI